MGGRGLPVPGWPRQVVVVDSPLSVSAADRSRRPKKATIGKEGRAGEDGWQYIEALERGEEVVQPAKDDEQMAGAEAAFEMEHRDAALQQCLSQLGTDDRSEGAGAGEPQYRQLVSGMSVRLYRWMQGVGIGCQRKRKLPPGS